MPIEIQRATGIRNFQSIADKNLQRFGHRIALTDVTSRNSSSFKDLPLTFLWHEINSSLRLPLMET